jgi:hypothetical protein
MGAPVQNQAQSSMGMQPTLPQQPTLSTGNQSNQYPIEQSQQMPNLPMGKGNVSNSATSGQPLMGMPNNNLNNGLGG